MTWNAAVPAGTDDIRDGDNVIRELKADIATALTAYGVFPISTGSPKFQYRGQKDTTANRPTNGEGGFYFDTTLNQLLRDNGSTWDVIGTPFAATTGLCFFQAAAPTGWTKQTAQNDKFLRVTSGSGGGASGTWATMAHTHTGPSHTHGLDDGYGLFSAISGSGITRIKTMTVSAWGVSHLATTTSSWGGSSDSPITTGMVLDGATEAGGTGNTGSTALTHGSTQHAYVDVIICTKD